MIEVGALLLLGLTGLAITFAILAAVKAVLWVVLLPFRLVFWIVGGLLILPVLLFKMVAGAVIFLLALPIVIVSVLAGLAAMVVALLVPLLPILLLVGGVWYLVRPETLGLLRI